jgi:hypothetical protein
MAEFAERHPTESGEVRMAVEVRDDDPVDECTDRRRLLEREALRDR